MPRCIISYDEVPSREILSQSTIEKYSLVNKWYLLSKPGSVSMLDTISHFQSIPMRIDWFYLFKNMHWTLVPDVNTLLDITRTLIRLKEEGRNGYPCQVINKATYPYIFTPLKLEGIPIHRRTASTQEFYEAPYKNFPILNLPLHPYVAIVHVYESFMNIGPLNLTDEQLQISNNVERIWSLWKALEHTKVIVDPSDSDELCISRSPNDSQPTHPSQQGRAVPQLRPKSLRLR